MRKTLLSLGAAGLVAACVSPDGPTEDYPFVGSWDCGVATFAFTNTTYNDGTETYPIRSVSRDGSNYTLRFGNGYLIGLGAVTETGLTWVSGATGDQFSCRRVN